MGLLGFILSETYISVHIMSVILHIDDIQGNGDEFTDEEHDLIEQKQYENSIRFDWKDGDVFIADNLCWAHGRYPYEGERNIMVIMGEPYSRYPYMIAQKQTIKQPLL